MISPCACDSPFSSYLNTVIGAIRNRKSLRRTHVLSHGNLHMETPNKKGEFHMERALKNLFGKRFLVNFFWQIFGKFFSENFFRNFFGRIFRNFGEFLAIVLCELMFWLIFCGAQALTERLRKRTRSRGPDARPDAHQKASSGESRQVGPIAPRASEWPSPSIIIAEYSFRHYWVPTLARQLVLQPLGFL